MEIKIIRADHPTFVAHCCTAEVWFQRPTPTVVSASAARGDNS